MAVDVYFESVDEVVLAAAGESERERRQRVELWLEETPADRGEKGDALEDLRMRAMRGATGPLKARRASAWWSRRPWWWPEPEAAASEAASERVTAALTSICRHSLKAASALSTRCSKLASSSSSETPSPRASVLQRLDARREEEERLTLVDVVGAKARVG